MTRARGAVLVLLAAAGALYVLTGSALAWGGVAIPELVRAQIPAEAPVDSAAVGGAMVALGGAAILVGVAHLVLVPGVRAARPSAMVAGIVGAATLALVAGATAVGALVALTASAADPSTMIPAAIGLAVVGATYAWLAALLVRIRASPLA